MEEDENRGKTTTLRTGLKKNDSPWCIRIHLWLIYAYARGIRPLSFNDPMRVIRLFPVATLNAGY